MTKEPVDMEQIREQYEDAALTLAEKDGKRTQDPDFDCPTDPDDPAAGTAERNPSALRRNRRMAFAWKLFSHVARVFLIAFLVFSLTFSTSSAFRDATLRFVEKTFRRGTAITGWDTTISDNVSDKAPGWLPDGDWKLSFYVNDPDSVVHRYHRPDDAFVNIYESDASLSIAIDTEDAEIRRDISINGNPSIMSIKEGVIILVWEDEERNLLFEISVGGAPDVVDPSVVIKIAESLP